jgi:Mce-associated membrane protein
VLGAARERITRDFQGRLYDANARSRDPGCQRKHVTPLVKVIAAAPVSTTASHAVVTLFVNQTVTAGETVVVAVYGQPVPRGR